MKSIQKVSKTRTDNTLFQTTTVSHIKNKENKQKWYLKQKQNEEQTKTISQTITLSQTTTASQSRTNMNIVSNKNKPMHRQ